MPQNVQADLEAIAALATVPIILDVVCRTTGMGFAAIARVTEDRWIACAVKDDIGFGLKPGGELKIETTICNEIRQNGTAVVIDHVKEDNRFRDHHTPAMYGFESYISMPIVRQDGTFFGTLCAIDPRPNRLNTPNTIDMFKMFADVIAGHLDSTDRLAETEARLAIERRDSELREEFIAVLGHDLRNPLANIMAGATLVLKRNGDARNGEVLRLMLGSANRMSSMIDNVLDFARGRLGGGLEVDVTSGPLKPILRQVLEELRATDSTRVFEADFGFDDPVSCDHDRIGQLFSNLVGNAMHHGAPGRPIKVRAEVGGGVFSLSVANEGTPIPVEARARLFEPFFREATSPAKQGLGLGLYISAAIARAHAGTLIVASDKAETRFTLQFPLR